MKFSLSIFFYCVLFASIFFDDPHLFYYKRVIYIIFVAISLWELYLFNFKKTSRQEYIKMPGFYKNYIILFCLCISYNLIVDFFNPSFSLVTLLNHPYSVLAIVPVFAFKIGYQTKRIEEFVKFLFFTCLMFYPVFFFPIPGRNIQGQAVVCYYAAIPLFIFSIVAKKYRLFAIVLLVMGFYLSQVSETRTIILRIILFMGLFVSLTWFKKWPAMKLLVVLTAGFFIWQFLTNIDAYMEFFKSYTGARNFDDEDTRTFLYKEIFGDLKTHELILGRGFQGTYFSEYFLWLQTNNNDFTGDHYFRFTVEVGFLQLLLKGGFVLFILYLTPLILTIQKCIFTNHKSHIAFLISIYLLCEIFIMFIENIPMYHLQFFIIFFLAGYAYRKATIDDPPALKYKKPFYDDFDHNAILQPGTVY